MTQAAVDLTVAAIARNLQTLDTQQAIAIASTVAQHRLTLPDDVAGKILDTMRAKLRHAAPPRRLDPKRLFCVPFEDLLVDGDPRTKTEGRISRASIHCAWALVAGEIGEETVREARTDTLHLTALDLGEPDGMGDRWWPCFALALSRVVDKLSSDRRYRAETAPLLDAPTRPADLREMLDCLNAWAEIKALRQVIERGTPYLNEDQVNAAVSVIVTGDRAGHRGDRIMDVALSRIGSSMMRQRFAKAVSRGGVKEADERAIEHAANMASQGLDAALFNGSTSKNIDILLDMLSRAKSLTTHADPRLKTLNVRFGVLVKEHLAPAAPLPDDPMQAARCLDADHMRLKALMAVRNNQAVDNAARQDAIDALNRRKDELERMLDTLRKSGHKSSIVYFATLRTIETVWGPEKVEETLIRDGVKADPSDSFSASRRAVS